MIMVRRSEKTRNYYSEYTTQECSTCPNILFSQEDENLAALA